MKVLAVCINLRDCEAVTLARHDKCWLESDIDKHFKSIGAGSLEEYKMCSGDEFIITELDLANKREEVERRTVTLAELCALLAESTDKPAAWGTF